MNPLTEIQFKVPFDQVKATDVEPAVDELLADANRRVETAVADPNPLKAIDIMTERLDYALSVVRHIESVATTPAFRAAFNAVQPKASAFYSSIPLNEGLWKAIKAYAGTEEGRSLKGTYHRFLTKTIDSFKRHGADLDPAGKARLKEIDVALTEATTKYSENVLDATNAWDMVVTAEEQLGSGDGTRGSRIQGRRGLAIHIAGSELRRRNDVPRRCANSRAGLARLQHPCGVR